MHSKHILVLSTPQPGGEWITTIRLIKSLKKTKKYTFSFVGCYTKKFSSGVFEQIFNISESSAKYPFRFIKKRLYIIQKSKLIISNYLSKNIVDYIITTNYLLAIGARLAKPKIPIIFYFHGIKNELHNFDYRQIFVRFLEIVALISSNMILTPSYYAKSFIYNYIWPFRKNVKIIKNFIPQYFYKKVNSSEKEIFRKKYKLNIKSKIILYSGRISKFKGLENLIKGFYEFKNKEHNVILVIAYPKFSVDSKLLNYINHFITTNKLKDKVTLLSDLNEKELITLYNISFVQILPSEIEMAPISITEGFAQGLPAITTRVGNTKELLSKLNINLLLANNTPTEIYSKLNWYLNLKKGEITKIRRKANTISENYREEKALKRITEIFKYIDSQSAAAE